MVLAKAVEDRLTELGMKPFAAEQAFGLPADTLRNITSRRPKRGAGPKLSKVAEICEALGLELYIGPPRPRPSATEMAEAAREFLTLDGDRNALASGYLPIPFNSRDLAHRDLSHIALAAAWVEDQGYDAEHLTAVIAPNDDMSPGIEEGELLLVDGSFQPGPEPTLSAFTVAGHLRIGWLTQPTAGSLVAFFQRSYTPPVICRGSRGASIDPVGRIAARLDTLPTPWVDADEKRRMLDMAKDLVSNF